MSTVRHVSVAMSFLIQSTILCVTAILFFAVKDAMLLITLCGVSILLCGVVQSGFSIATLSCSIVAVHVLIRGVIDVTGGCVLLLYRPMSTRLFTGLIAVLFLEKAFTLFYFCFVMRLELLTKSESDTSSSDMSVAFYKTFGITVPPVTTKKQKSPIKHVPMVPVFIMGCLVLAISVLFIYSAFSGMMIPFIVVAVCFLITAVALCMVSRLWFLPV